MYSILQYTKPFFYCNMPLSRCLVYCNMPLWRCLDCCDRMIQNESRDPNGSNVCLFSAASCTSQCNLRAENHRCILFSIFTRWRCYDVPTAIVAFLRRFNGVLSRSQVIMSSDSRSPSPMCEEAVEEPLHSPRRTSRANSPSSCRASGNSRSPSTSHIRWPSAVSIGTPNIVHIMHVC